MIVGDLTELSILGVYDRGTPNQERIVIAIRETVNMGQYGLMLGVRAGEGTAMPIRDNLLWFGDGIVNKGDWLFVYTGPGEARVSTIQNSTEKIYSVHWGRTQTIFASPDMSPILFRVDAVNVAADPINLPQLGA